MTFGDIFRHIHTFMTQFCVLIIYTSQTMLHNIHFKNMTFRNFFRHMYTFDEFFFVFRNFTPRKQKYTNVRFI